MRRGVQGIRGTMILRPVVSEAMALFEQFPLLTDNLVGKLLHIRRHLTGTGWSERKSQDWELRSSAEVLIVMSGGRLQLHACKEYVNEIHSGYDNSLK